MPPAHQSGPRFAPLRPPSPRPPVSWPACRPHGPPPPSCALHVARFPCPPLDSAGRVSVQPAADLRHLQRHRHAVHVSGALRACPLRPPASWPACRPLIYAFPLDSAGSGCVQPAAELRHLQRPEHAVHVSGAAPRLPMPPTHQSGPRRASLNKPPHSTSSRLLARLPPSQHAPLWTRQNTQAFNRPLSFDTSSFTNMDHLLDVCSAPAHATHSLVGPILRVT